MTGKKVNSVLVNTIELSNPARACDFSPDGKYFAVGYDKGVFEVFQVYDNDGTYFQLECLKLFDLNRPQYPVSCVSFTPDGRFLVITCHKDIVVFSCAGQGDDFQKVGLLKGNTQTVLHIQFDKQSQYAMTNSIDGTILCWQLVPGAFTKIDLAQLRDIEWDHSKDRCVLTWDCMGIWGKQQLK